MNCLPLTHALCVGRFIIVCNSFGANAWKAAYSRYLMNPDNYNAAVKENRDRRRQAEDARRQVEQTNATFSTGESLSSSNVPETDHGTPIESQTYREEVVQRQELGETNKEKVSNDSQNTLRVVTDSAEPTEEMIIPCITILRPFSSAKGAVRLRYLQFCTAVTKLMIDECHEA